MSKSGTSPAELFWYKSKSHARSDLSWQTLQNLNEEGRDQDVGTPHACLRMRNGTLMGAGYLAGVIESAGKIQDVQ
jgi:hypothetical protein